ncbi:MAG TPA: hypothetical protein VMN79_10615 [Casimicrobiaceae bacterium]|nr:hypothetical protein [Casimicrobiaceae bacterium]
MKAIAAAVLLLALGGTSYAQTGDPARGSTLYHTTYKCTDCHGDPPGANPANDQFLIKQGTPLGIANAVVLIPDMSARYLGILDVNAVDLADLSAYLAQFAAPPLSANYEGIWWNSPAGSESGWGINFEHQGDIIFATWFTYDTKGKGWWLVMIASKSAPNTYAGTLYTTSGPAFNAVPFNPANVVSTAVGSATLSFTDANNGSFSYTVNGVSQAKSITRQVFGPLPTCATAVDLAAATNYQGLWWAAPPGSESGWGVNFAHEGDTIFATWFTYDLDGTPLWLVAIAAKTAPGVYAGTLYRTTGPAFSAVPFDPANVVSTAVGNATLTFTDGNTGTFAYNVNGIAQVKAITRQVFSGTGTTCH